MSVARGFGMNGQALYTNVVKPMIITCNFVVDATNGNGLGVRSVKSNGYVEYVFMNTSSTPGKTGNFLNPNPAAGIVLVKLKNNFNVYLGGFSGIASPVTGSNVTTVVNHTSYVIVSLGTTTLAQWQAVGFPVGFTPAVGSSFVATASQAIGGTGAVKVPGVSGIVSSEIIGDPNQEIANSSIAANAGAMLMIQLLGATSSSVTTLIPTAPAAGSVISLSMWFDGSTVTVDGL